MNEKQIAAQKAAEFIEHGMVLGLGTGSTVAYMIEYLGEKIQKGLKVKAVSSSNKTTELAKSKGITLIDINETHAIDLTIDGADEIDEKLNGIKGGGGALLREKIIAKASKKNIWIVDSSKMVKQLGKFPLPVEIVPFGSEHTIKELDYRRLNPKYRNENETRFTTDGNNFIIDLHLNKIDNPDALEKELLNIPGVVDTGLFLEIVDKVIVGRKDSYEIIDRTV